MNWTDDAAESENTADFESVILRWLSLSQQAGRLRFSSTIFSLMASLHFCSECNNLLYPKADQTRRTMVHACRICTHFDMGDNTCVYRNDLLTVTKEQVGVTTDLGLDPTLPHSNIPCPKCGHEDAVYYQDQSKRKETRMILFFVCTKCNHSFMDPSLAPEGSIPEGIETET